MLKSALVESGFARMTTVNFTMLRDLTPGLKNVNLYVIVLEVGNPVVTKEGKEVRTIRVADRTGCVNVSVWDEYGRIIQSGDILTLMKVYVSVFKCGMTVNVGKFGEIQKIGEFCMVFSELPDYSVPKAEYKDFQLNQQKEKEEMRMRKSGEGRDGDKPGFHGMKKDKGERMPKPAPADVPPQGPRAAAPNDPRAQRWAPRDPRVAARKV